MGSLDSDGVGSRPAIRSTSKTSRQSKRDIVDSAAIANFNAKRESLRTEASMARTQTANSLSSRGGLSAIASDADEGAGVCQNSVSGWTVDTTASAPQLAADLSLGLFRDLQAATPLQGLGFQRLQVLSLAGAPLKTEHLEEVMTESKRLQKLDASHCCLAVAPSAAAFRGLTKLLTLFLHKNEMALWEDIDRAVQAPALQWFTAFENPIASQPEFRHFVIERRPYIQAVDHWVVTDGEHLGVRGHYQSRFAIQSQESIVKFESHLHPANRSPEILLREAQQELWDLRHQSNRCSAACCLQTVFRGRKTRKATNEEQRIRLSAVMTVQRRARTFLWRQRTHTYLKDYLAEINELDLLLSAKEMLRLRAAKRIEESVRAWINRRNKQKMLRHAAECVNRCLRGFMVRRLVLRKQLEIGRYRKIFFPEEYSWEFLVMLNVVRRNSGLPPLPRTHQFQRADIVGIRIPDTDEVPVRQSAIVSLVNFSQHCLVRPLRCNRFPEHQWDGPLHRLVDSCAEPHIIASYGQLKRRGCNFDNRCRKIFQKSCAPAGGKHPIEESSEEVDAEEVSLVMKSILEGPESDWPWEARQPGLPLNLFMLEARRLGARPRRSRKPQGLHGTNGTAQDPETGLNCYRSSYWLNSRLMYHTFDTDKINVDMLLLLLQLSKSPAQMPLVKPVPFVTEKAAIEIAAATSIQASFRAHLVRQHLSCGLRAAIVMRRAALCIQRYWRWGLMKRRLEMLIGARKYVQAVKSNCLYIEERLYYALNVICSIDRYPPLLHERSLGLGHITDEDGKSNVVFVRKDMGGIGKLKDTEAKETVRKRGQLRQGGLPSWFLRDIGGMQAVGPDDPALTTVNGVQGLITEDIGPRTEDNIYTVTMASIKHAAKLAADTEDSKKGSALVASGGTFRFYEMRFYSVAQARQRALVVYLCTHCAQRHTVVPLLSRSMLHDGNVCQTILQLWDMYGLTWQAGDRAAPHLLKRQGHKLLGDVRVVPLCGNQPMRHAIQGEWSGVDEKADRKGGLAERKAMREEASYQRYAAFAQQMADKRQREYAAQQQMLHETSIEALHETHSLGACQVSVVGAQPPTTSDRVEPGGGSIIHAEKTAAKSIIKAAREQELERIKQQHDSVVENKGKYKDALAFEEKIHAFHEQNNPGIKERRLHQVNEKIAREERRKEQTRIHALELAHKKAETKIIQKSQILDKVSEAIAVYNPEDQKEKEIEDLEQRKEEHRRKREIVKAKKAERKETHETVNQLLTKKFWIETACAKYDAVRRQDKDLAKAQTTLMNRRRIWAQRTAALAECQSVRQDYLHNEVQIMKDQVEEDLEAKRQMHDAEHMKKKWEITAKRTFKSLLKEAALEIEVANTDSFADDDSPDPDGAQSSYRRALQAFKDLAVEVEAMRKKDPDQVFRESLEKKGWTSTDPSSSKNKDDNSESADGDSLDGVPEELAGRLQHMQARARPGPTNHTPEQLLPPAQPVLEPPKGSGNLPPRMPMESPRPYDALDIANPGASTQRPNLPALHPEHQLASRAAQYFRQPHTGSASELEILDPADGMTEGLVGDDLVMNSLRKAQLAQFASTATLSTNVGSSQKTLQTLTNSRKTLHSSTESLPLSAAVALPPLPLQPAFRGNPRLPRISPSPLPARARLPRAPHTAR